MLPAAVALPPNSVLSCTGFCLSVGVMCDAETPCKLPFMLACIFQFCVVQCCGTEINRTEIKLYWKFIPHNLFISLEVLNAHIVYYTKPKGDFLPANKCLKLCSILFGYAHHMVSVVQLSNYVRSRWQSHMHCCMRCKIFRPTFTFIGKLIKGVAERWYTWCVTSRSLPWHIFF